MNNVTGAFFGVSYGLACSGIIVSIAEQYYDMRGFDPCTLEGYGFILMSGSLCFYGLATLCSQVL